jgi:ketosteroid isomerase-like protein
MDQDRPSRTGTSRRRALGVALSGAAAATAAQAADRRAEAEAALRAFLRAFENNDFAAMEAAFAPDAVSFDPVIADPKGSGPIDVSAMRRTPGMPPAMRALVQNAPKTASGPPYRRLEPKDLLVQADGDMALCTFHLDLPTSFARRTIVLVRRGGVWRILHIHASNVATS